ncbi:hypothetical protein [Polymorphospora sp. NPDC050346]|uniref:hypothetical protein n=1 Tax=Polymorphospora sp. NPDC050346 TaxID=3155780 RepID=UPI0033DB76DD
MPRASTTTGDAQKVFVDRLVYVADYWLEPVPDDTPDLEPVPARLNGAVVGLWLVLAGQIGPDPRYRLSPKGLPDIDLVDQHLLDHWHDPATDDPHVRGLIDAVRAILHRAEAADGDPRQAMGDLLVGLCRLIEDDYDLVPQPAGDTITPGLTAAITTAWR